VKWHKFSPDFWESETHDLLLHKHGEKGIVAYLRIISRIALELQTAEAVRYCHEFGWEKSLKDWARVIKFRPEFCFRFFRSLHETNKFFVENKCEDGPIRINLKIKNLREFVHPEALSSKERKLLGPVPGGPAGGPTGLTREDKKKKIYKGEIMSTQLAAIGGFPVSTQSVNKAEWREKIRAQAALVRGTPPTTPALEGPGGGSDEELS
jgi:hypothetical protein